MSYVVTYIKTLHKAMSRIEISNKTLVYLQSVCYKH